MLFTESAGQIAGQLGQVVSLRDPAESDEWVVVRFGRDELPFSPVDLQVAPRGATARKAARAAQPEPAPVRRPEPEFVMDKPVPPPRKAAGRNPATAAESSAPAAEKPEAETAAEKPAAESSAADMTAAEKTQAAGQAAAARKVDGVPAPRKAAGRAARPKSPAGLTVTLAYADGEWTVAATQGSKSLARPYVVRPAEALRMVALVDVPGVREAVEQIMAAERAEAEQQAERLRAELAEIEARLAELRDAG
ncbi:MAG TPA: hypothetical protein VF771_14830 [Longimicrobiaceae bacterium]